MKHLVLVVAWLAAIAGAGCAVSGGIETTTLTARNGEAEVVTRHVGGAIRCEPTATGQAPCRTASP
jgi:hypothetical protein